MRKHFMRKHPNDSITILEEGPYQKCHLCGMHVRPQSIGNHGNTQICQTGQELKRKRDAEQRAHQAASLEFHIGTTQIEMVDNFLYLGRPTLANDSDMGAMRYNLHKARKKWQMLSRLLVREGAKPRVMGLFYKAVVQSVLLYGSETWVITKTRYRLLNAFHVTAARRISRLTFRRNPDGEWVRPSAQLALERAGLFPLITYLRRRRDYILDYAKTLYDYPKLVNRKVIGEQSQKHFWTDDPDLAKLEKAIQSLEIED
jgi:hypothetical protein